MEIWCPVATGVQSIRSLEINVPVNSELSGNMSNGLQVKIKVPKSTKIEMFGIHTLASTYTAECDEQTKLMSDKKIKVPNKYQTCNLHIILICVKILVNSQRRS